MSSPKDLTKQKSITFLTLVIKRDGSVHPFDMSMIEAAISKAGAFTDEFDEEDIEELAMQVAFQRAQLPNTGAPHVDQIEDIIESVLFNAGHQKALRAFVVHRERCKSDGPDNATSAANASSMFKQTNLRYRYEYSTTPHYSADGLTFNWSKKIVRN